MSTPQTITSEIQKLQPSAVIELFVLDTTSVGGDIIRFHAGTNGLNSNIIWQGQEYIRFPIQVSGFEYNGQGQIPRPKLRVSNYLSTITILLMQYEDLIGCKVTRKRTLKKYLDNANFTVINPTEDITAEFPDDIYYIDRKATETREVVEFELAAAIDLSNVQFPRRQIIQNICAWRYRSAECGYTGTNYFKADDTPTELEAEDVCGKRVSSCECRFGVTSALPFGGFPGAGLVRG